MIHRNRRGTRAKVAVAAAVLVGGGAAGVVAIAANHGATTTNAQSAAFATRYRQTISEPTALMGAINGWNRSPGNAMTMLADMKPMRTFSQVGFHRTELAAQRGIVVLATKKFLLVKSANGSLHLWWLSGGTKFRNVTASATGMTAMTGSPSAAASVMTTGSMNSAAAAMAGSMSAVNTMTTPAAKPTTLTVSTGNEVITITISWTSATVTQPGATPAATVTATATPTASASAVPTATATQPVTMTTKGVARGDLVFVVGERVHGKLIAKLVLFAAPRTAVTPTPSASVSASVSATATVKPTGTSAAVPTVAPTPTGTGAFSGHNS